MNSKRLSPGGFQDRCHTIRRTLQNASEMAGQEGVEPSVLGLESNGLAINRLPRNTMAVDEGIEPSWVCTRQFSKLLPYLLG